MQLKQQLSRWILAVGLLTGGVGYAQTTQEEWSIETSGADELEQLMEFGDGSKSGVAAKSVSLRRFCPPVGNQAGQPSPLKLGWAAGYGMMSILHAKNTNAPTAREVFSSQFPFELMPKSAVGCRVENFVPQLRNILTQVGNVKAAQYDNKTPDCKAQPTESWQNKAAANRIDGLYLLFNKKSSSRSSSAAEIEARTKGSLSKGRPVMAVLMVDDAFRQLKADTWQPNNTGKTELQPVVVIGYDDSRRAFEVFNSMGTAWGSRGYGWVRYADFCEWSQLGLQMLWHPDSPVPPAPPRPEPNPRPTPPPVPTPIPPRPVVLRGSGQLRSVTGSTDNAYVFAPVAVRRKGNYYETDRHFEVNDGLQFVSNQLPRFGYVYLLSIDPSQKVELHFPKTGDSPYIADENSRLVFPRPRSGYDSQNHLVLTERQFTKEKNGADWLVVLYSKERLNENQLQNWLDALAVPSQQVVSTLEQLLGKAIVPWQSVQFSPQKMQFSVNANANGSIVPLLVKINGN